MEKLNLIQFILIQQEKLSLVSKMFFKKFCIGGITGLMKDLVGLLNPLRPSTLTFQLIGH